MEYNITVENFEEEVLKSELPVLVDFYADWCGPCKMMAPVIAKIAEEYEGKLKVGKCDTEDNMALAQQYRISSIPNLLLFKEGKLVESYLGFKQHDELKGLIDQVL